MKEPQTAFDCLDTSEELWEEIGQNGTLFIECWNIPEEEELTRELKRFALSVGIELLNVSFFRGECPHG